MSEARALIVDDEADIRELLTITLRRMNVATDAAADLDGARRLLADHSFDLCLTDMRLPDGNGLELVEWIQVNADQVPVAVITAHGNVEAAVQALKLGAFDFVSKPVDLENLRRLVQTALRLRGAGDHPVPEDKLIGESRAMSKVREMIIKVARSQAPVHISGESGTGKELVARLIHDSGPRSEQAFVPVNCGAIPTELMESEFFGHRKGSFTGAVNDKDGLFRSAGGGTLFLDEVADLPLHMQVKLLRAIQEKAVRPLGEAHEQAVDVRILSATHRDLAELVAAGKFREDLYYRINVIELCVPPLRERGNDVLAIADSILARLAETWEVATPALSENAREALRQYHFPGNVRELENILERAMTLASGERISQEDLQLRAGGDEAVAATEPDDLSATLTQRLDDVERQTIIRALEQTKYNKTAAARLLGISFRALRYRIKKLGLE
ncbi:MAG: sigma-54 dependent transcriptional regulator [Gammaproteobacteria bacterium]|nr:sigma-54 dependent transcriptional regulator [Gammaproteobacteria bacterium]NNF62157.1 sigma-54-dependent Fis family transcriptional regulator [Gammaproteobacteria bacterium]NNM21848.1 sigma-54-dependent Fis family transcriptional regulator [Gammaproteobacteria bacterium]